MDEFGVYKVYIALKLHFTTDNYDIIKNRGRIKASKNAFAKRKDLFSIRKIAKTYTDEEITNFLVSNFVSGNRWGGMFDSDAGKTYLAWKGKIESLSYLFEQELDELINNLEMDGMKVEDIFKLSDSQHPYLLKAFLRKTISIETLVILEKINPFVAHFDTYLKHDILWPDISRIIIKYKPFLRIDKEKYNEIFRRRFTG